jgi:hypothetical protein
MLRHDRSLRPGRTHRAAPFDANNRYSVGGAIRVGRALEELGFFWFEEPMHYHVRAMGEVARALDITVSRRRIRSRVLQISSPPASA